MPQPFDLPRAELAGRKRLLVLAGYPRSVAATRYRTCAYFDALSAAGIDAELSPFIDEDLMRVLYRPGGAARKGTGMLKALARRGAELLRLLGRQRYDGVFIQREATLLGPAWFEHALSRLGLPMIYDIDDAVWVSQTAVSSNPLANRLLRNPRKTLGVLGLAHEVITATHYLAECVEPHKHPKANLTVLPTVVDATSFSPRKGRLDGELASGEPVPVLGWIGTPSTALHLDVLVPALTALAADGHRFRLRLVGASRTLQIPGVEVESLDWSEAREAEDFRHLDIGLAPMADNDEFARGKGGFKQIQYMCVGAPMVSSFVGGAREFLVHDENALIVNQLGDWYDHLRALLTDQALRARLAQNGHKLALAKYCTAALQEPFVQVVARALARSPGRRHS